MPAKTKTEQTSVFSTSIVFSFAAAVILSISAPRFSNVHTLTLFPVVLCAALCTFHSPTWNGGACATAGSDAEPPEPDEFWTGVPEREEVAEEKEVVEEGPKV